MAELSRLQLKNLFLNGAKPNQDDFRDVFDSFYNKVDDSLADGWVCRFVGSNHFELPFVRFEIPLGASRLENIRIFGWLGQLFGNAPIDVELELFYFSDILNTTQGYNSSSLASIFLHEIFDANFNNAPRIFDETFPIGLNLEYSSMHNLTVSADITPNFVFLFICLEYS